MGKFSTHLFLFFFSTSTTQERQITALLCEAVQCSSSKQTRFILASWKTKCFVLFKKNKTKKILDVVDFLFFSFNNINVIHLILLMLRQVSFLSGREISLFKM